MSENRTNLDRPKVRRHRKSEINLALFLFQASYQGHHQDLSDVLLSVKIKNEKRWLVLNARDAEGMPILINCLKGAAQVEGEKDHLECIKVLLLTGIPLDSKDASERTAIHWAVLLDKYEICRYLLQQGAQADLIDSGNDSPLHIAISKRSQPFVQLLCEFGSKSILEAKDHLERTPLCHALLINSTNVFEQLIIRGCDVNGKMNDGKTLIVYTVEKNLFEFVEILMKHKVNLHPYGLNNINVIHLAACQKESSVLDVISRYCSKEELNSINQSGKTALMLAVDNEICGNTSVLLNKNVNTKLQDVEGNTALHFTNRNSTAEIVDILLKHDGDLINICNNYHRYPINNAVSANNRIVVRALLDHGADMDVVDSEGHTLVHYASEFSSVACLAELASVGLSLNVPDKHGIYPIHYAVRLVTTASTSKTLKIEFLKQIVAAGVDLNVADDRGLQPIHWAVCMGFFEALKILLIEDVNANSITKDEQYSPLHLACNSNQFECLDLLLSQPTVAVDQVDSQGRTPLHTACSLKDPRFTEALLNAGANPEHQDKEGKTPAHIASTNCTVDCLWLLSLKRANFDVKNNNEETPIHLACKNADDACVRFLLTRKCNVNATQKNGLTALHIAVTSKNAQKTSLLLQNGAKWNQIYHGKDTITPLDIALENGDYKCIKLLQSFGARTAHSILTQSAITIQHAWKKHRKKKVALGEVPFQNTSSIYSSSNTSESVSIKGGTRKTENPPDDIITKDEYATTGNESSEILTLHGQSTSSQADVDGRQYNTGSAEPIHHNGVCNGCPEIPQYMMDILSMESRREFQETLARSDREILLMRELMKETEQLLVRAKRVNEVADSLTNSDSFRNIKKSNKNYMEEKRKKQQMNSNSKHKFLERLIEEYPP